MIIGPHSGSAPVLAEAREQATISGGRFLDIVNGIVCHQDRDECRAIAHRKSHAADCHAASPTDDRLTSRSLSSVLPRTVSAPTSHGSRA